MDITGRPLDQLLLSEMTAEIGCIRKTLQTPEVFNEENLGTWMLMNGQSCTGTLYESKFGTTVVPDAYTEGTFLRQAKDGVATGTYQGDAIRNITGKAYGYDNAMNSAGGTGAFTPVGYGTRGYEPDNVAEGGEYTGWDFDASRVVPVADENRPKNIAVNFMIKVDHN